MTRAALLMLCCLVVACDDERASTTPARDVGPQADAAAGPDGGAPEPAGEVVRLALRPPGRVAAPGTPLDFQVVGLDAAGREAPVHGEVVWRVEDPEVLAVEGGRVTTTQTVGVGVVRAELGDLVSGPAVVTVARVKPQVVQIDDDAVGALVDVRRVDDALEYDLTFTAAPPAEGTLVLGTGASPVYGRVLAVQGAVATLQVVPPAEIFDELELDRTFDLNQFPKVLEPDLQGEFTLEPDADGFDRLVPVADPNPDGLTAERYFGKFKCKIEGGFEFSTGATVELKFKNALRFHTKFGLVSGPVHLGVTGGFTGIATLKPRFNLTAPGSAQCRREIYTQTVPFGPLAWLFSGKIPVGFGAKIELKFVSNGIGYDTGFQAGVRDVDLGLRCDPECRVADQISFFMEPTEPKFVFPGPVDAFLDIGRIEGALNVFAFAKFGLGPTFDLPGVSEVVELDFIEAQVGLGFGAAFGTPAHQANDPTFANSYKVQLYEKLTIEPKASLFKGWLSLSLFKVEFSNTNVLSRSPAGTFTAPPGPFQPGEQAELRFQLMHPTFLTADNLGDLVVMRHQGGGELQEIARIATVPGQLDYVHTLEVAGGRPDYTLSAYIEPLILGITPFELGDHTEQRFEVDDPYDLAVRIGTLPIAGQPLPVLIEATEQVGELAMPIADAPVVLTTDDGQRAEGRTAADGTLTLPVRTPAAERLALLAELTLPGGGQLVRTRQLRVFASAQDVDIPGDLLDPDGTNGGQGFYAGFCTDSTQGAARSYPCTISANPEGASWSWQPEWSDNPFRGSINIDGFDGAGAFTGHGTPANAFGDECEGVLGPESIRFSCVGTRNGQRYDMWSVSGSSAR